MVSTYLNEMKPPKQLFLITKELYIALSSRLQLGIALFCSIGGKATLRFAEVQII